MPKTVSVKLQKPILDHGGNKGSVILREPRGAEFIEIGEPYAYARAEKGLIVHAENDQAIKAYLMCCIEEPDCLLVMSQASLVDMINLKDALLGFFADARLARLANGSSSSSSTSAGSPPTGPAI